MTLYDFLNYFLSLGSKDLYGIVGSMNYYVEQVAQTTKLPAMVFSALGIVVGIFLGLLGYKLLKPFVTVVLSGIGFFAGVFLFILLYFHITKIISGIFSGRILLILQMELLLHQVRLQLHTQQGLRL